jgi:YVTN family beta-propeller protein
MAFDQDNGYLYVSNAGTNGSIYVFDVSSRNLITRVVLDTPSGVPVYVSSVHRLYFLSTDGLGILDTVSNHEMGSVLLPGTPDALCYDSLVERIYVSVSSSDSVYAVSVSNDSVVSEIHVGSEPKGIYCDSQGGRVFVANFEGSSISVIDSATDSILDTLSTPPYPASVIVPEGIPYMYVLRGDPASPDPYGAGELTVLRTSDYGSVANLSTGPVGASPVNSLTFDPRNRDVYVAQYSPFVNGSVLAIDTSSNRIVGRIVVGAYVTAIADSGGGLLFVCDQSGYGNTTLIMVIDDSSNAISGQMVEPSPFSLAVDSSNGMVFVATSGSPDVQQLLVLNRSYSSWLDTVPLSLGNIFPHQSSYGSFDPSSGYVYVADYGGGTISVFNGADGNLVGTIPLDGTWVYGVTCISAKGELYATVSDLDKVVIINTTTESVIGQIGVGTDPVGMAYDLASGRLYVADYGSVPGLGGSVTVVDAKANKRVTTISFSDSRLSIQDVLLASDGFLYAFGWHYGNPATSWGELYKINVTSDTIVSSVPAGLADGNSGEMAEDPLGRIYVASGNFIQVYDTSQGTFLGNITAGVETTDVAYNPFTGDMLATNLVSGTVSIISTGAPPLDVQSVTLKEAGLFPGTEWGVGNSSLGQSTKGQQLTFALPAGSYKFSPRIPQGYIAQNVNFMVGSRAVTVNVTFSPTGAQRTTATTVSLASGTNAVTLSGGESTALRTPVGTTVQSASTGPPEGGVSLQGWEASLALVLGALTLTAFSYYVLRRGSGLRSPRNSAR